MGASNFFNKNASNIFVGTCEDEFDYDDLRENLHYGFKSHFGSEYQRLNEWDSERNYSGRYIAEFEEWKEYSGVDVGVKVKVVMRSGYYQHVNVDWEVEFTVGNQDYYEEDVLQSEITEDLTWANGDLTEKRAKYIAQFVEKWLEDTKERLTDEVEKVIKQYTTEYGVTARFSNGETWYEEINA